MKDTKKWCWECNQCRRLISEYPCKHCGWEREKDALECNAENGMFECEEASDD